jgi:cyclopropane fatty-acyl-phospholipid synthase-like methyltransferase
MPSFSYPGTELDLFAQARQWKSYLGSRIRPFVGGRVLEVGAGIGGSTRALWSEAVSEWTCIEPDPKLATQLGERIQSGTLPGPCVSIVGTLDSVADTPAKFDSILYVDVLEHIQHDREELARAETLLSEGGRLIVLSPAHQVLYSEFDEHVGHYRRYNRRTLLEISPPGLRLLHLEYLDSMGLIASAANRSVLRMSRPSSREVQFWDRLFVPISRRLDRVLGHRVGKSILVVWEK